MGVSIPTPLYFSVPFLKFSFFIGNFIYFYKITILSPSCHRSTILSNRQPRPLSPLTSPEGRREKGLTMSGKGLERRLVMGSRVRIWRTMMV